LYSSKYLVKPPCPEGILILLSRAILSLKIYWFYKVFGNFLILKTQKGFAFAWVFGNF